MLAGLYSFAILIGIFPIVGHRSLFVISIDCLLHYCFVDLIPLVLSAPNQSLFLNVVLILLNRYLNRCNKTEHRSISFLNIIPFKKFSTLLVMVIFIYIQGYGKCHSLFKNLILLLRPSIIRCLDKNLS